MRTFLSKALILVALYTLDKLVDMLPRLSPEKEPEPENYFQIELEGNLRYALLDLIRGSKKPPSAVLRALETAVMAGREVNLPRALLDWGEVEERAREARSTEADAFWDIANKR
jgi:hypothetical protein